MNLLGHTYVAVASDEDGRPDPLFVLGAALPDLASLARVRVNRSRLGSLDRRLADGVDCHVRADAAFHAHPLFLQGSARLRRALAEQGLRSGPARAIGHAGWELLLDGTLVGTPVETAFEEALRRADEASLAMTPPERWAGFLARRGDRGRLAYDEPGWVAAVLHRMLRPRPRLSFSLDQLPLVTMILRQQQAGVVAVASEVLSATAEAAA